MGKDSNKNLVGQQIFKQIIDLISPLGVDPCKAGQVLPTSF